MDVIKKKYPILDENGMPSTYPTFASQVFFSDGSALEGKNFSVDPMTIYPVGSIYMSSGSASPAALFGGVWEQIKDRFLLGAGDTSSLGDEGGEAEVSLTNEAQNAPHEHAFSVKVGSKSSTDGALFYGGGNWTRNFKANDGSSYPPIVFNKSGSGSPHNNMPPYLSVNIWRRMA